VESPVEIVHRASAALPEPHFHSIFTRSGAVEKNLRLHKSRALTFQAIGLGWLTSTVERVSQNKS
jgi:hypothetical protein